MASYKFTHQQLHKVSLDRGHLIEIAMNEDLSKKDLRVLLLLFTELDGYQESDNATNQKDPLNYRRINISSIAETLNMKKKEVNKSIDELFSNGYLEQGSNDIVKDGYRFTF